MPRAKVQIVLCKVVMIVDLDVNFKVIENRNYFLLLLCGTVEEMRGASGVWGKWVA